MTVAEEADRLAQIVSEGRFWQALLDFHAEAPKLPEDIEALVRDA